MTAVTQIIPNYLGGVSRQPDEKKQTGQSIEILNGYPDPTNGLTKRNGFEFVASLDTDMSALDNAAWFLINRDAFELYYGCITTAGTIRIWDVLNRVEIPEEDIGFVGTSKDYLGDGLTFNDYKFLTVQDVTFIVNKTAKVLQNYGKDANGDYLDKPLPYEPNNVATVKLQTVEYSAKYEIFIESPFVNVPIIRYDSPAPPNVGGNNFLTAETILKSIAKKIPPEFFEVTVLNTSLEITSKTFTGRKVFDGSGIILYEGESGNLYFTKSDETEKIYIKSGETFVTSTYDGFNADAIVEADTGIQLAFISNVPDQDYPTNTTFTSNYLRVYDVSPTGELSSSFTPYEKGGRPDSGEGDTTNPDRPTEPPDRPTEPEPEPDVSDEEAEYWDQEDLFRADFDKDRFVGNPDPAVGNPVVPRLIWNDLVYNSRDDLTLKVNQYDELGVKFGYGPWDPLPLYDDSYTDPETGNLVWAGPAPGTIGNFKVVGIGRRPPAEAPADDYYGTDSFWVVYQDGLSTRSTRYLGNQNARQSSYGSVAVGATDEQKAGFYQAEDDCYQDLNEDYFLGDPELVLPAPFKPRVDPPKGFPFTIEVKAGIDGSGLDTYQSEVENSARLAAVSINDRRVKVNNTSDDRSAYFVKFVANNPSNTLAGNGYWEEDLGWEEYDGLADEIEVEEPYVALASFGVRPETMPHILKVPSPGKFEFDTYPYVERLVGSELSNSSPSFVNNTITNMLLDNNRLGFLSEESIILSQSGEFGNFYYVSAQTVIDSDPIDLNCSSLRPAKLHSTLPSAQGLILFSKFEQFVLFSESGILTPSDSVIRSISKYESDPLMSPVDVGTSFMFVSKTPNSTRIMGMVTRGLEYNPVVVDISKIVADYVPPDTDLLVSSGQNSFVALSGRNNNTMYFYRFFNNGEKDVMQAWFKWELPGEVQSHIIAQDTLFIVVRNERGYQIVQSPISQAVQIQNKVNLRIDNYFACNDPRLDTQPLVYDASKNRTKLPSPYTLPVSDKYIAYITSEVNVNSTPTTVSETSTRLIYINDGDAFVGGGFISVITIEGQEWFIDGDWSGNAPDGTPWRNRIIVGELYDFEVELPSTYFRPVENISDYTASLTVARYKFSLGESGEVNFFSKARGSEEWNMVGAVSDANYYSADTPAITNETILTVPIYQRNKNFDFKIQADTPLPVSLNSMMWEGKYVPRNYRRA